ncbi:phosphatase family protein-like protein [Phyllosticta citricarpa]|uniref:Phosphatase family protein-like protein n=1 Tax=Phyllosticta citricarpa TaxID=55181 RepID=A0ABR1LVA0_9PEZI
MPPETDPASCLDQSIPGAFPVAVSAASSSTPHSLHQAIYARRAEYVRPKEIRIKVGTWNVASFKDTHKDVASWFVRAKPFDVPSSAVDPAVPTQSTAAPTTSGEPPRENSPYQDDATDQKNSASSEAESTPDVSGDVDLYVLGLQEVVDITSAAEALRPYTDPATAAKFKSSMEDALPKGYKLVAEQQLIGLLLLVFASPSVAPEVRSVSTASVGTGLMGYMGNKGGVAARIVLGETTRLVFINSHLAAGADKTALERRNWDAAQVASRAKFDPIVDSMGVSHENSESLGEEDFAFWFGDLNYRLEGMPGNDVRRLLMLHARNEYDSDEISNPSFARTSLDTAKEDDAESTSESVDPDDVLKPEPLPPSLDPASLQATLDSLLPHDELRQQQKAKKAFHDGWREGDIDFLPTYKYDVGTVGVFDSSEKRRCPSWCDRILFRTRRDKSAYEQKIKEEDEIKKRDEEMKKEGLDSTNDDEVLFEYDPATDADDDYDEFADTGEEPETVTTKGGFDDEIQLEHYGAYQEVLSSDHKPLVAVFRLKYDSVVPELKAHVLAEVAKELDRAENEGRPGVTLIVERDHSKKETSDGKQQSFDGVNFGPIRYLEAKRRNVTVANTGQVPATIGFFGQPGSDEDETKLPSWLSMRFDREPDKAGAAINPHYTLDPGEACNIELEIKIDDLQLVRDLNEDRAQLEDILVLRVNDGRDHFLPIRAEWQQSAFGRSIDKLIRIPEGGARKLQHKRMSSDGGKKSSDNRSSDDSSSPGTRFWSAPRELFRLTESLEDLLERAVAEWGMMDHEDGTLAPWSAAAQNTTGSGWPFAPESWTFKDSNARERMKCSIADAIDDDKPVEQAFDAEDTSIMKLETLSETLVLFLKSLEDGVVPADLWTKLEAGYDDQTKSKKQPSRDEERTWILEVIGKSPNHSVTFVLMTSMLGRVATEIRNAGKGDAAGITSPTSPIKRTLTAVGGRMRSASEAQKNAAQSVEKGLAGALAEAMIRTGEKAAGKDKDRQLRRQRMMRAVEVFVAPDA